MVLTPGANLRYLTGYNAKPLERLIALVLPANGEPTLIVPELERAAAEAAGVDMEVVAWTETENPYAVLDRRLAGARSIAVDDQMWAVRLLAIQSARPDATVVGAGTLMAELRSRKDAQEVEALHEAAQAIDRVHARMGDWLCPGRTERQVGAEIARAIVDEGHARVDFVIVASGPNGASPHHDVSDRAIEPGDPVVVDIGGTMPSGYCSDSTRTYVAGGQPSQEFTDSYAFLLTAQTAQREAAAPGTEAQALDAVGRTILADAGLSDYFIHRTGHGIGLETHEDPYIVAGNSTVLEPGMAFSIEPGFYIPGQHGARIEDIVVLTEGGADVLNASPRDLVILD